MTTKTSREIAEFVLNGPSEKEILCQIESLVQLARAVKAAYQEANDSIQAVERIDELNETLSRVEKLVEI